MDILEVRFFLCGRGGGNITPCLKLVKIMLIVWTPCASKRGRVKFFKTDGNWGGRGVWNFCKKRMGGGGIKQNRGGGFHIILRFSGVSSWCSIEKKSSCVSFSFVNKHVLQINCLKLVSAIFYQISIFSPNDSPSKIVKNVFYFI